MDSRLEDEIRPTNSATTEWFLHKQHNEPILRTQTLAASGLHRHAGLRWSGDGGLHDLGDPHGHTAEGGGPPEPVEEWAMAKVRGVSPLVLLNTLSHG